MRFEHIVRNSPGTLQYAVLSNGESRQVLVACWPADNDRIERLACATYPAGADNGETRGSRDEAVRLAHGIAHALAGPNGRPNEAQAWLEAALATIDPGAVQRVSALRRQAEEQQDGAIRRRQPRQRRRAS